MVILVWSLSNLCHMARIGKDFTLVVELDVCQVRGIGKVASAPDLVQGFLP